MRKFKGVLQNISYTLSSNLLSLIVSILVTLLLPRFLGVEEYGYYQLYLLYISYVGFLHLGWCDGVYLRHGGENYQDLDKKLLRNQFYSLVFTQLLITAILIGITVLSEFESLQKEAVIYFSILNIIILNVRTFIILILQTTNRMKDYSFIIISDRVSFVVLVIVLLLFKNNNVTYYIIADIIGKIISLFIAVGKTREITSFNSMYTFEWEFQEIKENINSGINLMFANIASSLIIGIIRFGIQGKWSIVVFGKIALSLSVSNMLMIFINAISLAVFPLIKRTEVSKYSTIYPIIRTILMPTIFVLLLMYYPMSYILSIWLPAYKESFHYMAIVFPIVVFEGKVSLITNTYLKALRKEKIIFKVNFFTAILSLVLTIVNIYIFRNLFLTILSIPLLLAIRSAISEIYLAKMLNVKIYKTMLLENFLVLIFIFSGWFIQGLFGMIIYIFFLSLYLLLIKDDIKNTVLLINSDV